MAEEIGFYDAKTRLPELLRRVVCGERFTITRQGQPVAELVPPGKAARDGVAKAVADMRNFERIRGVRAKDIVDWIAEGRR